MRTTVILDDDIYARLVSTAVGRYGSAKNLSRALNALLARVFEEESLPESMFGAWRGEKGLNTAGLREEGEPH